MANEFDSKTYDIMRQTLKDIEYMHGLSVKRLVKPKVALHSIGQRLDNYNDEMAQLHEGAEKELS